tara:strand:+ start:190 stop:681 length:492 start_codon:yes stop_codon:yes gene_type:complete
MAAPNEYWKLIPNTKDYFASINGEINRNGKNLSLCRNAGGYLIVNINSKTFLVHRLIANTFIDNTESKRTVNHINGSKTDNSVKNLEWNTHSENLHHKYKVLKNKPQKNFGSNNGFSKTILNLDSGIYFESITEAANSINIKRTTLNAMLTGQSKNKTNLIYA